MAVVIRLMRAGAKKRPFYRMVAADSRRQRDGRFLEILGHYNPVSKPFELVVHKEKVEAWIAKGAQPSEQVASLLRKVGVSTAAPKTGPLKPAAAPAAEANATPAPATKKKAAKKKAAGAKRAVKRVVSGRKVKAKVARKSGKKKPATKKAKKK
ncbi:MAG: 30S ribosomal protein S16 [Candidatus Eisenbacteria bacterium]